MASKHFKLILKSLKNFAITYFFGWLIFSPVPGENTNQPKQSKQSIEKILSITGGSVDNLDEKKFLREMLAKHFPDWETRVSIENQEARIYYKATRRLKEYKKFNPLLKIPENFLTDEEKSAIDYFHGRGDYKKYQDPKVFPNLLDTRKTFLKKMEDKEMREKFLEYYNRMNPIE
jgi:hypothetical protein